MRANILCPGPSLVQAPKSGYRGIVIAVNQARDYVESHDWWVCGDAVARGMSTDHRTKIGVASTERVPSAPCMVYWKDLGLDPTAFSFVAAILLTRHLGHESVEIWGADMCGDRYFDGVGAATLNAQRWALERQMVESAILELPEITFTFHKGLVYAPR